MHTTSTQPADVSIRVLTAIAALAGFAIPVSTALQNISIALFGVAVLLIPATRQRIAAALREPFPLGCLVFYGVLVAGMFWAPSTSLGFSMLGKMRPYLLVPLFFAGCTFLPVRQGVLAGFGAGTLLSVILSIGAALLHHPIMAGVVGDYGTFRTHTYHDTFAGFVILAIAAFALRGRIAPRYRAIAAVAFLACLVDVFLFVAGRSAQGVLLAALCGLFVLWNVRKGLIGIAVLAVLAVALFMSSHMLRSEIARVQHDVQEAQKGVLVYADGRDNSVGKRMYFWRNALAVVKEAPVFGHGTGSYHTIISEDHGAEGGSNPHCDYLWFAVEIGIVGVLAALWMLIGGVVQASRLAPPESWIAILLVGTYAATSLANSYFTDNITGSGFIVLAAATMTGPWFAQPSDTTRATKQS
jgi:O-antigen ligase